MSIYIFPLCFAKLASVGTLIYIKSRHIYTFWWASIILKSHQKVYCYVNSHSTDFYRKLTGNSCKLCFWTCLRRGSLNGIWHLWFTSCCPDKPNFLRWILWCILYSPTSTLYMSWNPVRFCLIDSSVLKSFSHFFILRSLAYLSCVFLVSVQAWNLMWTFYFINCLSHKSTVQSVISGFMSNLSSSSLSSY